MYSLLGPALVSDLLSLKRLGFNSICDTVDMFIHWYDVNKEAEAAV